MFGINYYGVSPANLKSTLEDYRSTFGEDFTLRDLLMILDIDAKHSIADAISGIPDNLYVPAEEMTAIADSLAAVAGAVAESRCSDDSCCEIAEDVNRIACAVEEIAESGDEDYDDSDDAEQESIWNDSEARNRLLKELGSERYTVVFTQMFDDCHGFVVIADKERTEKDDLVEMYFTIFPEGAKVFLREGMSLDDSELKGVVERVAYFWKKNAED